MVLNAALDNGYIFLSLVAILRSVIGAVYYLNVVNRTGPPDRWRSMVQIVKCTSMLVISAAASPI